MLDLRMRPRASFPSAVRQYASNFAHEYRMGTGNLGIAKIRRYESTASSIATNDSARILNRVK